MADETTQATAKSIDAAGATGVEETAQPTEQNNEQQQQTAEGAAAQAAQQAERDANKPWYAALPDTTHEALKGFKDMDEVAAAAARGKDYTPAKELSEYKIKLSQEAPGSEAVLAEYAQFCLDQGITPTQAQAAVTWQEQLAEKTKDMLIESGTTALKAKWGANYEGNRAKALVALQMLDRKMEGRLGPALAANGLNNDPAVVEVLHVIAGAISEDSLGTGGAGASNNDKEQDPVDTFRDLGFK